MTISARIFNLVGLIIVTTVVSCSNNTSPLDELKATEEQGKYQVKTGDTLTVAVWGEPRLSGEVFVREDGNFSMALVEDVFVEGKTTKEVAAEVQSRLEKFVPGASVSVSVAQSAPIRYFLSGQFNKPGEYRSDRRITVLQAIATGGGFAPFARESAITLIRRTATGEKRYALDYGRVIDGSQPNPELKNGDIIAVK
jgi:polysaccharide export outer membrane protein